MITAKQGKIIYFMEAEMHLIRVNVKKHFKM